MAGEFIADEKAIWQVLVHYARATSLGKLAPHDLRRTAPSCVARPAGSSNKFNCRPYRRPKQM